MARIRTVKPEFYRHEGLQDLEAANPGKHVMLVFSALWGHCDKAGRFEWKPRTLKLDILPFLDFDLTKTLAELCIGGFVRRYKVDGKEYGEIVTFEKHQRITGREAQEPEKHPPPPENKRGNTGEAHEKQSGRQEGKGREEEGEREGNGGCTGASLPVPVENGLNEKTETALQAACRATWRAYVEAFRQRYGAEPIRDAKANSCIKSFVQSVGMEEAPQIARFYVGHNKAFYVQRCHEPSMLKADAAGLRTEWITGRRVTANGAREADRLQDTGDMWGRIIDQHEQSGVVHGKP